MAEATEPEKTEVEAVAEKTEEQVADERLDELVGQMNAGTDDEPEDEDDETLDLPLEEKTKPEPEASKKSEAKAETWKPATLVRFAKQLGVSEARIASLSAAELDTLCDSIAEQRETEIAAKAKEDEKPVEEDEDEVLLRELQEDLDPKVFKLLEKSVKKTKAIEAERAAEKQTAERKRIEGMVAEVDAAFAELDSPLLGGKAEGRTFDQQTEEMERRNLIVRMAMEKPIQGKSLREAVKFYSKKILGIAASEAPEATKTDATEERKRKWAAASTSPPTKRAEYEEPGDEAAVKAVGKWMKDAGWSND